MCTSLYASFSVTSKKEMIPNGPEVVVQKGGVVLIVTEGGKVWTSETAFLFFMMYFVLSAMKMKTDLIGECFFL